jgi:alginate O-acetyltransferase complex protein AlgJ
MPNVQRMRAIEDWLLIGLFLVALVAPLIAMAIIPGQSTSSDEYRTLAPRPPLPQTLREFAKFPGRFGLYFNDHFGFRRPLIRLQALVKVKALGGSVTPQVIVGKDGWLFLDPAYDPSLSQSRSEKPFTSEQLARWQQALVVRHDWLAQRGIRYLFVIVPEKQSIYPEYLPDSNRYLQQTSRFDQLVIYLKENSDLEILDLRPPLLAAKQSRRVYFKTDTHWNARGGLVASQAIVRELAKSFPEMKPLDESDCVTVRTAMSTGDLARMMGLNGWFVEEVEGMQIRAPGFVLQVESHGTDWMLVTTNRDQHLPRLLAFCDSFSMALATFLSQHFNRAVYRQQLYFDPGQVELERPQIVMQEMAERYLMDDPPPDLLPARK